MINVRLGRFKLCTLGLLLSTQALAQPASPSASEKIAAIQAIATKSQCAAHYWSLRGRAPNVYVGGMALVFARAVCQPEREDVKLVSNAPDVTDTSHDALAAYASVFSARGMKNDVSGVDVLRHAYVLLIGLGMMESSGMSGVSASGTKQVVL